MFLGLVTFNLFPVIRMLWLHGKFPKQRPDDPTAVQAIVRAFIPWFNFYWVPFGIGRLATRLNEQRREAGLPELRLYGLVIAFFLFTGSGFFFGLPLRWLLDEKDIFMFFLVVGPFVNLLLIVPLLGSAIQNGANALTDVARTKRHPNPAAFLVRTELKWRLRQRIVWGIYPGVLALFHLLFLGLILLLSRFEKDKIEVAVYHFVFISVPLMIVAATLFGRAWLMARRCARLDAAPSEAVAIVAAERRTTSISLFVWCGILTLVGLGIVGKVMVVAISHGLHRYAVKDTIMPLLLIFGIPTFTGAVHLLVRACQLAASPSEDATTPVLGLQLRPTPWWPAASGAMAALLLVLLIAAWSRFDRGQDLVFSGSADAVKKTTAPKAKDESIVGTWKAPGAGDFKEITADFDKNGHGMIRGTFAGGGGIRTEFTYELNGGVLTVWIADETKSRRGAARLTSDTTLRLSIPGHIVLGDGETIFTRDAK